MAMLKIERKIQSAKAALVKAEARQASDPDANPDILKRARKRMRDLKARRGRQIAAGAKAAETKGPAGKKLAGVKAAITRYSNQRTIAETRSDKIRLGKLIREKQSELEGLAA